MCFYGFSTDCPIVIVIMGSERNIWTLTVCFCLPDVKVFKSFQTDIRNCRRLWSPGKPLPSSWITPRHLPSNLRAESLHDRALASVLKTNQSDGNTWQLLQSLPFFWWFYGFIWMLFPCNQIIFLSFACGIGQHWCFMGNFALTFGKLFFFSFIYQQDYVLTFPWL